MRFLTATLIALSFGLLGILRNIGALDIGVVHLFSVQELRGIDMSYITDFTQKLFFIPDTIFNLSKSWLKDVLPNNYFFSLKYLNIYFITIFYFIFSYISLICIAIFPFKRDKIYLSLLIISFYLLLLALL